MKTSLVFRKGSVERENSYRYSRAVVRPAKPTPENALSISKFSHISRHATALHICIFARTLEKAHIHKYSARHFPPFLCFEEERLRETNEERTRERERFSFFPCNFQKYAIVYARYGQLQSQRRQTRHNTARSRCADMLH